MLAVYAVLGVFRRTRDVRPVNGESPPTRLTPEASSPPRGDSRGSGRRGIQSEPLAVSQGNCASAAVREACGKAPTAVRKA